MKDMHLFESLVKFTKNQRSNAHWRHKKDQRDYLLPPPMLDEEWRIKFAQARARGESPMISISAAVSRWLAVICPITRRACDQTKLRNSLLRFCETVGPDLPVSAISAAVLSDYRDTLIERGLSGSSTNTYVYDVRSVLNCCRDNWELIDRVPKIKMYPKHRSLKFLTEAEERRLLKACEANPPMWRYVRFILGTGARRNEAVGLTWEDVIFSRRKSERSRVLFRQTKNGMPHSIALPNYLARMLREMYARRDPDIPHVFTYVPMRDRRDDKGRLLAAMGEETRLSQPNYPFKLLRENAGLPNITIHSLRHTYATRLISKGIPLIVVGRLLNHKNADSTMIYSHLTVGQVDKAIAVLDEKESSLPKTGAKAKRRAPRKSQPAKPRAR